MVNLLSLLSKLAPRKILVAGDLLFDKYTYGRVKRISPEAPIPIVHVEREEYLPGGAGNVAKNLSALGAQVRLVGRVGDDAHGRDLLQLLRDEGVDTTYTLQQEGHITPIKNRLIASSQQLIRFDYEETSTLPPLLESKLIEALPSLLDGIEAVAISDYDKGFFTPKILKELIHLAKEKEIPIIVDPKGRDFSKYKGATLIKPNLSEAIEAAGASQAMPLDQIAGKILSENQIDHLIITRSEKGISLFSPGEERKDFPVQVREVKDVTGAGDTVLSILTFALSNSFHLPEAISLANIGAGMTIEKVGCTSLTLQELTERLLLFTHKTKIFDDEHLFALKKSLSEKKYTLLSLEKGTVLNEALFLAIEELGKDDEILVIFVEEKGEDDPLIAFLASLDEVSFVILKRHNLENLLQHLHPTRSLLFSSNQLMTSPIPSFSGLSS